MPHFRARMYVMEDKIVYAKVFPSAKKEKVIALENNAFEIYVREPAQRNMANTRVRECIANHFGIPTSKVIMQTGHRTRKKSFIIQT